MIDEKPIGAALSRSLGRQSAPGEKVEAELSRLIEKRTAVEDPETKDALWLRSVERYNARRREENRRAWCDYFCRLAVYLRGRADEYDRRAALLEDEAPWA